MARLRSNTKRAVWATLSLIVVLCCAFGAFYMISMKQVEAVYKEELSAKTAIIDGNTKVVYRAARDFKYGEAVTADGVVAESHIATIDSSLFFTAEDIGAVLKVDVSAGSVLMSSMVGSRACDDTLRETQFDVLVLNSNLTDGDYVDVRIRYRDGEDYVVLSQKCVKHLYLYNATCYLDLTEEEMQMMSSAIVDAGLYGAILYTATYLEPGVQKPSVVTYQPSGEILGVILSSPNIVEVVTENLSAAARETMEKRLNAYQNMLANGGTGAENVFNVTGAPPIEDAGNRQNGEYIAEPAPAAGGRAD